MAASSQRPVSQDRALASLNTAINVLNLGKEVPNVTPAKAAFGSVSALLAMIKDSMVNDADYVDLALQCADICTALDRGMSGKRLDGFSQSISDAIDQLTRIVAEIQRKAVKQSGRPKLSRILHSRNNKDTIASWKSDLDRILHVFNTELTMNTHAVVAGVHQNILRVLEDNDSRDWVIQSRPATSTTKGFCLHPTSIPNVLGESPPPPPPRVFFGRDELIERIVALVESLTPIALIGAGGIGKTSTALTVLHDDRVKQRFGHNRSFIRCDQFPPSCIHFLRRLSEVIGAGIENPEDIASLRPLLSSREIFMVLDNVESILDSYGADAHEVYAVVEELSQFTNICLCITSRTSTAPPGCEIIDVPTLSMEAARDTFHGIYKHCERSNQIDSVFEQLDFHPLSVTLLATVAQQNRWDANRLTREWKRQRTEVLHARHYRSLATTIELSLASPIFRRLGSSARELLGVVAFFPQGVDEKNVDWLFPTVPGGPDTFDKFCALSLVYRNDGFLTMLAPLRDYLRLKDPKSSPLLSTIKDRYFRRLSVEVYPGKPGYEEAGWIISEDVNVEHLLDIFTSANTDTLDTWDACAHFMEHVFRHKQRLSMLGPKIEGLPDDHPSKPRCLFELSRLFHSVGNYAESKRLLTYTLQLRRERGEDREVAQTLRHLSNANRMLHFPEEGMEQAEEALEIYERLGDAAGQARCFVVLGWVLYNEGLLLDTAEVAVSRAMNLLPEEDEQFQICRCHRILGHIYWSKGKRERAIECLNTALEIASSFNWINQLCWIHYSLAVLLFDEGRSDEAEARVECVKSCATQSNSMYELGRAMELQARIWYDQDKYEEARSEALGAVDVFEKLGAASFVERTKDLLQYVERASGDVVSSNSYEDVETHFRYLGRFQSTSSQPLVPPLTSYQSFQNCHLPQPLFSFPPR